MAALTLKNASSKITPFSFQVRGMATEKQILMRITSTRNIAKITKSMKMVSAAKMRGAQNRLDDGRPFANWLTNLFGKPVQIDLSNPSLENRQLENAKNDTFFVISSDRGLCGGCNSFITKAARFELEKSEKSGMSSQLVVVGEKGRAQIRRTHGHLVAANVADYRTVQTFAQACAIVESVQNQTQSYDVAHIMYNRFHSAIAYFQTIRTLPNLNSTHMEHLAEYEFEPDNKNEVLQDLQEFQLASAIYYGMLEGATSEESSRMAAMENATKNATELIQDLTLVYNKARQSRITTELIEIISGASSLDSAE